MSFSKQLLFVIVKYISKYFLYLNEIFVDVGYKFPYTIWI